MKNVVKCIEQTVVYGSHEILTKNLHEEAVREVSITSFVINCVGHTLLGVAFALQFSCPTTYARMVWFMVRNAADTMTHSQ